MSGKLAINPRGGAPSNKPLNGKAFMLFTAISATAVIITAAYYLWAIHCAFLGKLNPIYKDYPDLVWRERVVLYPLGAIAIVLGFYPQAVLSVINPALIQLISGLKPM